MICEDREPGNEAICITSLYHTQTFVVAPPVKWEYHIISCSYLYGLGKRVPAIFNLIGWLLHFRASHSIISATKWAVAKWPVNMATFYHKKSCYIAVTASSAQLYAKVFVEWVPEQNQCIYIFNLQIPEFMGTYNLQILAPRHFWVHTTCYISLVPRVLHMVTIEIVKAVPVALFPGLCHRPVFVVSSPDPTLLRGEMFWWTKWISWVVHAFATF